MKQEKHQPNARLWLSHGLQEYAQHCLKGDAAAIAASLQLPEDVIRGYMKGNVKDMEVGRMVLGAMRERVMGQ